MANPQVQLQSGLIRGVVDKHEEGFDYYAFKGIPYAEPPVGELRFKDPVPIKSWSGVIDCHDYGPKCLQYDYFSKNISYDEDCLHVNVFTRVFNAKAPVMVLIHRGAFTGCSSDDFYYGPQHLIRKNLVFVTFNYRLGVLGFLNLEHEIAPGNQGLKDQILALQWVQANIRAFGGDPDNVTLLGISAGGISAHFLSLSPLAKGMAYQTSLHFGPGMDAKAANPVMPIDPEFAASQGVHLPVLTGYNAREGIILLLEVSRSDFFKACNLDFGEIFKHSSTYLLQRYNLTKAQVRRLYYGSVVVSLDNLERFVDFASDVYFVSGVHRFARLQADQGSAATYLYVYGYDAADSISRKILQHAPTGASHLDELPFLFRIRALEKLKIDCLKNNARSQKMMEQLTEMWFNFAAYGRPTVNIFELTPVQWLPINDGTVLRYLSLDEDICMQSTINLDQKFLAARGIKL